MDWDPIVLYIEKSGLDWTAIVSLGGLAVAALVLILNYNLRKVPFQQALHTKQIDTALEMMTKLRVFQDAFFGVIHPARRGVGEQNLSIIRQETGCLITRLLYDLERFSILLPSPLMESLGRYARVVMDLQRPEEGFAARLSAFRAPEDMSLVAAFRDVAETARKELRVEPLTEETRKLIGCERYGGS